jgi:hypothetical protein
VPNNYGFTATSRLAPMQMKILTFLGISLVGLIALGAASKLNKEDIYQMGDAIERINAPDFGWNLDMIEPWEQTAVISDYERRGYKLKCYGNLRVEERITKDEDYQCWAIIKSAYNIPAKIVTFSFKKQKLMLVRLEFKEKAYEELHSYLNKKMAHSERLDTQPGHDFGVDTYGKRLVVWRTRYGIVTSSEYTPNHNNIVLWSGY